MLIENVLILARGGVDILLLDDDVAMPNRLDDRPEDLVRIFQTPTVKGHQSGTGRI